VEISREGWKSSPTVVIARGDDYADALAGVPLAYSLGAPILLVSPGYLPEVTRREISRLGSSHAIILGGVGAVSMDVATALRDMGLKVERIAGDNRFDTAVRLAARLAPEGVSTAVIANGRKFPDALAAAPYAAVMGYPVLLVETNSIPAVVETALKGLGVNDTIVVGGTSVVSSSLYNRLPQPSRISGSDRYATAVALAKHFAPGGNKVFIATGQSFADAITGGVLAARENAGLLLVGGSVPNEVSAYLRESEIKTICILGGTGAVSAGVASTLKNILAPAGTAGLTGWTVPGASVTVSGKTATASANGSYQVEALPAGKTTAIFSLEGYGSQTYIVNIVAGRYSVLIADLVGMDPRKIVLRGTVADKVTDRPLEGAAVVLETMTDSKTWVAAAGAETDKYGDYEFKNTGRDLFSFGERVRLTICQGSDEDFKNGYHPVVLNVDLKRDGVDNVAPGVEMVPIKPLNISGRVTFPDNEPVAGKGVCLRSGDKSVFVNTNTQGDYLFQDLTLATGKYTIFLDFTSNEQAVYCKEVSISEGKDLSHSIKLAEGYTVRVETKAEKDGESFKTSGVYKAALLQGSSLLAETAAQIWEDGKLLTFDWSRIASGNYTVRVSGDYAVSKTFTIQVSKSGYTSTNQRLTRAGAIKGTVKDTGGLGIPQTKVELVTAGGQVAATGETDSDGKYCFGGLAGGGKYTVRVSAQGYRPGVSEQQVIAVNEDKVADFTLPVMPATASVSGTVRSTGSLALAKGAKVAFRALNVAGKERGEKVKETNVKADGTYQVELPPGSYTVVIADPGKHETLEAALTVAAGDVISDRSYRLQPGGNASLTVTVRTSANKAVSPISLTDKWGDTISQTTTTGSVVFADLSVGSYLLTAAASGHEDLEQRLEIGKGTVISRDYTLVSSAQARKVEFWVVGESNDSLKDARIHILSGTKKVAEGLTSGNGKLQLRLPEGSYTAVVFAGGYFQSKVTFKVGSRDLVVPVICLDKW
jgi:putative cell wall-binding protein